MEEELDNYSIDFLLFRFVVSFCTITSYLIGNAHYVGILIGYTSVPTIVRDAPGGCSLALRKIWFAKTTRHLMRGFLLRLTNKFIKMPPLPKRCVIALCHTPWALVLSHWCRENNHALVVTRSKKWKMRTREINVSGGFSQTRKLIQHLLNDGKVCVHFDTSKSKTVISNLLGVNRPVSMLPVRLAGYTEAPLIGMIPIFENGNLKLKISKPFFVGHQGKEQMQAIQNLVSFFDQEITQHPAALRGVLKNKNISPII